MSVTASVGGEGDASSYGGARLSDRVLQRSHAVSQSRVIFKGTGWGTGLQQPRCGRTLQPQQSEQFGSLTNAFSFIGHD